ncbi:hypothetical protein [Tranquillimonas rosea]|uniref:hypothetical protein n=1 Tax=Tranquillimonas rosea TaxID=641238 RepID=UPI0011606E4C|nr:hypothetical protein [Tranquillimonas rosea]
MRELRFLPLTLLLLPDSLLAQSEVVFIVQADFLRCMAENSEDYLATVGSDGLLYVVQQSLIAGKCPEIPENPLLELTLNSGSDGPDGPIQELNLNEPDPLIILSPQEFTCLVDKVSSLVPGSYWLYPERCELERL